MPEIPSDLSAPSIALPCGSRMPDFRVTVTRAFMRPLTDHAQAVPGIRDCLRPNIKTWTAGTSPVPAARQVVEDLMHGFGRLRLQQATVACEPAALADQPHRGPERRRCA